MPAEVWDEVVRGHGGRPDVSFVAADATTGAHTATVLLHSGVFKDSYPGYVTPSDEAT